MRGRVAPLFLGLLLLASGLSAQGPLPMDALALQHRAAVQDILDRLDFTFQIRTPPRKVRLATVETGLSAQGPLPMDALALQHRAAVQDILDRLDFTFQIRTPPRKVRLATVEKLYDRPRLCAAMWRYCQFVPTFYTFELPPAAFTVDDLRGLHGTMTLIYKRPGAEGPGRPWAAA